MKSSSARRLNRRLAKMRKRTTPMIPKVIVPAMNPNNGRIILRSSRAAAKGSQAADGSERNPVLLLQSMNFRERMGSGGPPGLQILVSGASGVRGGFDSHAFPPIFALAAVWLMLAVFLVCPAIADLPPGAPGAAPAPPLDSLVTPPPTPADTAGKL